MIYWLKYCKQTTLICDSKFKECKNFVRALRLFGKTEQQSSSSTTFDRPPIWISNEDKFNSWYHHKQQAWKHIQITWWTNYKLKTNSGIIRQKNNTKEKFYTYPLKSKIIQEAPLAPKTIVNILSQIYIYMKFVHLMLSYSLPGKDIDGICVE